jgi:DNA-binding CsgD family transcriptional regulator
MAVSRQAAVPEANMQTRPIPAAPYRQVFVGRDEELRQLQAMLDGAIGSRGAIVALLGEPGIGKTALTEQLTAYARERGARTLIGHCYEGGSLSLPYLPFVEALRKHVLDTDPEVLRAELGDGASDLVRILPELRSRVPVADRHASDPDADRWRLLHAVTDFLRAMSDVQPLLLVLEDLHDADRASLDLLIHLSRNVADAHLLVLCTYRDVDVVRTHPLSAALAELRRASHFLRVPLRGLTEPDVQQMLASLSQQAIPPIFAELVHRQTEGNPLFVQELLRYVLELGLVEAREGTLRRVGERRLAERIPEGLRDVIGQRLSRLSDRANQVLAIASVVGREFPIDVLARVSRLPEEDVIAALEEAIAVGLVQEQSTAGSSTVYRFTHAFFRQTLYAELSAPRRIRWHLNAAAVLEEVFAGRLTQHCAALAEHWSHSSDPADLAKAVAYCELAAEQASRVYAYGEAARHLERALDIQNALDQDNIAKRCDLLLGLGAALVLAGSGRRAADEVATVALQLATALGDRGRVFRACKVALDGVQTLCGWASASLPAYAEWAEQADRSAQHESSERAAANRVMGVVRAARGERRAARSLWMPALALAHQQQDRGAMFELAMGLLSITAFPEIWPDQVQLAETFSSYARDEISPRHVGNVLMYAGMVLLAEGRRDRFNEVWRASIEIHARGYPAGAYVMQPGKEALVALLEGQLERVIQLGNTGRERGDEVGRPVMGRNLPGWFSYAAWLYLGQPGRALDVLLDFVAATGATRPETMTQLMLGVCYTRIGRADEAMALAGAVLNGDTSEWQVAELELGLEWALLSQEREIAARFVKRLAPVGHLAMVHGFTPCVARLFGQHWIQTGDPTRARAAFEQAVAVCERMRCRPELVLARLDLAELLLSHFPLERRQALENLQFVRTEARSMNMQPTLERAARLEQAAAVEDGLTQRERQVAVLIAAGRSNREIAETLVITESTAEVHVKHILSKLGFRSRAQVAVWAAERGLPRP